MSEVIVDTTELLQIFKTGVTQSVALVEHMPGEHRIEAWTFWKDISKVVANGIEEITVTGDGELANVLGLNEYSAIVEPRNSSETEPASDQVQTLVIHSSEEVSTSGIGERTEWTYVQDADIKLNDDTVIAAKDLPDIKNQTLLKDGSLIRTLLQSPNSEECKFEKLQGQAAQVRADVKQENVKSISPHLASSSVRKSKRKKSDAKVYESIIPKSRKKLKLDTEYVVSDTAQISSESKGISCTSASELVGGGYPPTSEEVKENDYFQVNILKDIDDDSDEHGECFGDDVSFSETSSADNQNQLLTFTLAGGGEESKIDSSEHHKVQTQKQSQSRLSQVKNCPTENKKAITLENVEGYASDIEIVDRAEAQREKKNDSSKHRKTQTRKKNKSKMSPVKNLPTENANLMTLENVEDCASDIEIVVRAEVQKKKRGRRPKNSARTRSALKEWPHTKIKMSKEEKCTCLMCGKMLSNYSNLKVHMRSHNGEKPFKCGECGRAFSTRPNLVRHERTHRGEKPYECPDCHQHFTEKKSMQIHRRGHTGEKPYQCRICQRQFTQSGTLATHLLIHAGTKSNMCDICGKSFRQKTQLRLHLLRHDNIRKYSCKTCQKAFITKGDLHRHSVRHTGERPFKCNVCPKSFTRMQYVKEHMNKHMGLKPYPCKVCGITFSDAASCNRHVKKHDEKVQLLARIDGEETYVVYLDAEQLLQASRGEKALVVGENGSLNFQEIHVDSDSLAGSLDSEGAQTLVANEISETAFMVEIQKPDSGSDDLAQDNVKQEDLSQSKEGSTTAAVQHLELETLLLAKQFENKSDEQTSERESCAPTDGSGVPIFEDQSLVDAQKT